MAKKKIENQEESTKRPSLEKASFLDKKGKTIKLLDVIDKETDCWFLKGKGLWILTHSTTEKIAKMSGISNNFEVDESPNISPTYQNELEHIVRVTIHCTAKNPDGTEGCVHSDENTFTVTGESNRINTPHRGRGFLRKMAEKRGFDIAVLKHLGLYTTVFSEDEAEDFKEPGSRKDVSILPGSKEFESISEEINMILNAKDKKEIKVIGKQIKERVSEKKYSERQYNYLKELFQKTVAKMINIF